MENPDMPFVIEKGPTSLEWNTSKIVFSYKDHTEKRGNYEQNKIEQQFIFPRTMRAQSIRVVYYTKHSKESKGSFAYIMRNKLEIFDPNPKISITRKTSIISESRDSFDVSKCGGQQLQKYEQQAASLVVYLEKNYSVRISKLVLDFVNDFQSNPYLIGCKAIELEPCTTMSEYLLRM